MDYIEMAKFAIPFLAIGGAWGGAKVALNGTREKVREIEVDVEHMKIDTIDRLARLETKIDSLLENR